MRNFLGKWLNLYQDEIGLFLWSALLLFLIRTSNIVFMNFAETAFLKRFGVEYLPIVYMVNPIVSVFLMGLLTALMGKFSGSRLLAYTLLACGATVAGLRFLIPLGFDLLYPILFILKAQYQVLLVLLFWNVANDLFNTRQSKRLFPLITAGGALGAVLGSFGTPPLAGLISRDNLLLAYLGTTVLGAISVKAMAARFPTLVLSVGEKVKKRPRHSFTDELKKILPLVKESTLVKVLILLSLMPNIALQILNYLFNFTIDQQFVTETKMLEFFGLFRGAQGVISVILLLFVGRMFGRWGLPVALMFHPINYLLAFLAFLFRFDVVSAVYARISTNVLNTTMNTPARAILVGLMPAAYRSVIRPFLRVTVVRTGVFIGSGLILILGPLFHPRYLSLVASTFVGIWILTTFFFKRHYSGILLGLISKDMLDLKSLEGEEEVQRIFKDKNVLSLLYQRFSSARGEDALWYARLLKSMGEKDLERHILSALQRQDDQTKIALIELLPDRLGEEAVQVLRREADPAKPELMTALSRAASRSPTEAAHHFLHEIMETSRDPEPRAYAAAALYRQDPARYGALIDTLLRSDKEAEKKAGIIAAGNSGDPKYLPLLRERLEKEEASPILSSLLRALHQLRAPDINDLSLSFLDHPQEEVRLGALEALEIENEEAARKVIALMGDPSDTIHGLAKQKLENAPYQNTQLLVQSLVIPRRKVREGIFDLLESLEIKDLEIFRFARHQLEKAYLNLYEAEAVRRLPPSNERDLLADHLDQKKKIRLDNTLRGLAAQDRTGRMRTIWLGISSSDPRQRSNSIEALEDLMDSSLTKIMVPILENLSSSQVLAVGKRHFDLPRLDSKPARLYSHLLGKKDWVTLVLTLQLLAKQGLDGLGKGTVKALTTSRDRRVQQMLRLVMEDRFGATNDGKEGPLEDQITIPDKILHLKGIQIFQGLTVSQLAAIASVTEEVVYAPGQTVIREGEPGDTMYLVISGEVVVTKAGLQEKGAYEIELDRIGRGDYFGEMALFEDIPRTASIRTAQESRLLVLRKQDFREIVREYPEIALHICKELSGRIRRLHEKVKSYEK